MKKNITQDKIFQKTARTDRIKMQLGLSLVELMIAVAIIGVLVLVLSQSLLSTIRSNMKAEVQKELKENGDYALDYIGRSIRNAKSVAIGGTDCREFTIAGSSMNITTLTDVTIPIECGIGTPPRIFIDGNAITSDGVEVSSCSIQCPSPQEGAPVTIGITFELKQFGTSTDAYDTASQIFTSTFTLRNK